MASPISIRKVMPKPVEKRTVSVKPSIFIFKSLISV